MKTQLQGSDKLRNILRLLHIAALVSGAAIFLCSCENNIEQIKAFVSTENLPVIQAENFETTFTDSCQVRFHLKAPRLQRFEADGQPYIEFPDGLELIKYDARKRIISSIKARYARQYLQDKKWEAKNDVVAVNAAGDTLKTELLVWDEKAEKIYSDKFVRIIRSDQIINGIGFESDQALLNWRIKNPTGSIYVNVQNQENIQEQTTDSVKSKGRFNEPVQIKQ
jgi:LPS export ABC transporter protein LptC